MRSDRATPVVLSTACFPGRTAYGFRMAADHGYDGVELVVTHDRRSQTAAAVRRLIAEYEVPVRSVHVPCFLLTQHVWGFDPIAKLQRALELAALVGAGTVVTHPPFRWQWSYARQFAAAVADLHGLGGVSLAVENMFPAHVFGRSLPIFSHTDPALPGFAAVTLDTSHAAASGAELIAVAAEMGPRLEHVHLSDSLRRGGDEHLPPGEGRLPLRELADELVTRGFAGDVVIEAHLFRVARNSRSSVLRDSRDWARAAFRVPAPAAVA
jgi:sugar phosphate isomerase/epimerase